MPLIITSGMDTCKRGDNGGSNPNYRPNSFDDIEADETYKEPFMQLESDMADWFDRNENDDDHYTQPGIMYRDVMTEQDRENLVSNIVQSMSGISGMKKDEIINRQLCHFLHVDGQLGIAVAKGLDITVSDIELGRKSPCNF